MTRFDKAQVAKHFSRAASSYGDHNQLQRDTAAQLLTLIAPSVANCHIVDVGCGPAVMTQALVEHLHTDHYQGVDLAPGMLEFAREKFPQHDFTQADAEQLPNADGSADVVVSNLMMQWLNEPSQALEELVRIAAPAGQIVLSTVLAGSLSELETCWAKLGVKPAVNRFATPSEWHSLLNNLEANAKVASVDFFIQSYRYAYSGVRELFAHLKGIGANYHPASTAGRPLRRSDIDALNLCMTRLFGTVSGNWSIGFIAINIEK